jgi:hypothetical protein
VGQEEAGGVSDFKECPICHRYHWTTSPCLPIFYYNRPDWHGKDGWCQIRASDFEDAAEKACDKMDSDNEYEIVSTGYLDEIRIKDEEGTIKRFKVEAEAVPQYRAEELPETGAR